MARTIIRIESKQQADLVAVEWPDLKLTSHYWVKKCNSNSTQYLKFKTLVNCYYNIEKVETN